MPAAVGESLDLVGRHPPTRDERAEHDGARALLAHGIGAGLARAERIERKIADGGPVARACETMRDSPILERLCRRAFARLDIGKNLDRRADPRRWRHQSDTNRKIRAITIIHISPSAIAPTRNTPVRRSRRLDVTCI